MIWGLLALSGVLIGALIWAYKLGKRLERVENQNSNEKALREQTERVTKVLIKTADRMVKSEKVKQKLSSTSNVDEFLRVYSKEVLGIDPDPSS